MNKGALFSECRKYRYFLFRTWDDEKPLALCIGLNPSTANDVDDDPTIRNLCDLLSSLGYGGFYMCNLFACISKNPDDIRLFPDPLKMNDHVINSVRSECRDVIFCWGSFKQAKYRVKTMIQLFPDALCFGKTKSGDPLHPLAATIWMRKKMKLQKFCA